MRRLRAADGSGPDRRITDQTIFTMNRLFALCASGLLLASCAGKTGSYELIPYPNHLTPRAGEFAAAGAAVACDGSTKPRAPWSKSSRPGSRKPRGPRAR